jgi:hypothetical protein
VDGGTSRARDHTRLAQRGDASALLESPFQRAQLAVDRRERPELGQYERVVALREAVQLEDQTAQIPVGELARPAQEAQTAPHTTALGEARRLRCADG